MRDGAIGEVHPELHRPCAVEPELQHVADYPDDLGSLSRPALGVAIGIAGAVALSRVLRSLLFGVSATDPLTYGAIASALILVALGACWLPARRAAGVDPVIALRAE